MAEILPNSPNDVASRGVTNTTLAQFKGLARQVVINIDDNYRPVIMDGQTLGGKSKVALLADLEELPNALTQLITENGGTVPQGQSLQTLSLSDETYDPWAELA